MPGQDPLLGAPPPRDWRAFATEEAQRQGVDPSLVHRVIDRESKWNLRAISPKGAEGLMQLMPETSRSLGVTDPFDGEQNIRAGIKYLKSRLDARKGDVRLALADYNAGPANVNRYRGLPPFNETEQYVQAIAGPDQADPSLIDAGGDEIADPSLIDEAADVSQIDPSFDARVAQAAGKATRLTPGYSAPVDVLRAVPAAVGSMAGSLVKAGGGPLGVAAGTVLSAGGAALGEAATVGAEHLAYRTGLSEVPPPPWNAALDRVKGAALTAAGGEAIGRPIGAVASKVTGPFKGSVDGTGLEVQKMFPDALPNQVSDSRALDAATAVAEASIAGGKRITQRKEQLANQALQEATSIVHRYGGPITKEKAGDLFQQALERNTQAFKDHGRTLYREVDNLSGGVKVSLDSLKAFAARELEKRGGVPSEVSGNRGLKMLQQVARAGEDDAEAKQFAELAKGLGVSVEELQQPRYKSLLGAIGVTDQPMAKEMTFEQAQTFRSDLLSFIRRAKSEKDDVAKGVAQQLVSRLEAAMDDTAATVPGLKDAYATANTYWRAGKEKYESELMRGLAEQYPEDVVERLVTPGATTPIREARAAIGPEAWKKVQARVADDILTHATKDDVIRGDKLLEKLRGMSTATLKEVYPNDEARALWTLGRVLERSQRKSNPYAKTGILLAQGGVLVGATQFNLDPLTAGGVLLTPALLTRILTSKTGAKWLTTGLEAGWKTKLGMTAARKLAEQLGYSWAGGRSGQPGEPPPGPTPPRSAGPPPPPQ